MTTTTTPRYPDVLGLDVFLFLPPRYCSIVDCFYLCIMRQLHSNPLSRSMLDCVQLLREILSFLNSTHSRLSSSAIACCLDYQAHLEYLSQKRRKKREGGKNAGDRLNEWMNDRGTRGKKALNWYSFFSPSSSSSVWPSRERNETSLSADAGTIRLVYFFSLSRRAHFADDDCR